MAVVWFVSRNTAVEEEDYLYMNCEKCRQKIRYREEKSARSPFAVGVNNVYHYPEKK